MNIIHMDLRLNEDRRGQTGTEDGSDVVKVRPGGEKLLEGGGKGLGSERLELRVRSSPEPALKGSSAGSA
jgi:hypothetical protein